MAKESATIKFPDCCFTNKDGKLVLPEGVSVPDWDELYDKYSKYFDFFRQGNRSRASEVLRDIIESEHVHLVHLAEGMLDILSDDPTPQMGDAMKDIYSRLPTEVMDFMDISYEDFVRGADLCGDTALLFQKRSYDYMEKNEHCFVRLDR